MPSRKTIGCFWYARSALLPKIFPLIAIFALLNTADAQSWSANWIWQSAAGPNNTFLCLRKKVSLYMQPPSAPTRIAAENKYWLYINGQLVIPDGGLDLHPGLSTSGGIVSTYYDSVDIAPYLVAGDNIIAVLAWYKGGTNGYTQMMTGNGGFLFESDLTGPVSPNPRTIVSDSTWKVLVHPSFSITSQEQQMGAWKWIEYPVIYDARKSPGNWMADSFPDITWASAKKKGVPPAAPWDTLVARTIPMKKIFPLTPYQNQSSIPTSITTNTTIIGVVGSNVQGYAYLNITAPAGVNVAIRMNQWYTENYITTSGTQQYTTYQWQNTSGEPWKRCDVEYAFTNVTGTVTINALRFQQSGYNTNFAGSFNSSNSWVNLLWTKCRATSYLCLGDEYYGCPDREPSQWWGDASEQLLYSFYLFDSTSSLLAKKGLRELTNTLMSNGSPYSTAPGNAFWLPDQDLAAITSIGDYFLYTGDSALVRQVYPRMAAYLKTYLPGTMDANGMLILQSGGIIWNWIDWGTDLNIVTGSADAVVNGLFVRLMEAAKTMASVYGSTADVTYYQGLETAVKNHFNQYFWNASSKAYVEYYYNNAQATSIDDRSNAWAVLAGVADSTRQPGVLNILKSQIDACPYQERYIEDAMFAMHKTDAALARMNKFYQFDLTSWSPTMWEGMPASAGDSSNNHAWSSSACYLLGAYVAGIVPTAAGFSTYHVFPQLGDSLDSVAQTIWTPRGIISVNHHIYPTSYTLALTSPSTTIATVGIPKRDSIAIATVTVNGTKVWQNKAYVGAVSGIDSAGQDTNYLKFTAGPGTWNFVAAYGSALGLKTAPAPMPTDALKLTISNTRVMFRVACAGSFAVGVFNAEGKPVTVYHGRDQGSFTVARNIMANGVYFVQLKSTDRSIVKKFFLSR